MSYSTQVDLLLQLDNTTLINLTNDVGSGIVESNVVSQAISDADALIDSYLSSLYAVPLATVPVIIKNISVDIAIYNLYSRRMDTLPDVRKDRFVSAIKYLQRIADSKMSLPDISVSGTSELIAATTVKTDRAFTIGKTSDNSVGTLDDY